MAKTLGNIEMSTSEIRSQLSLNVRIKGMRTFTFRNWLGFLIMRTGARVVGIEMEIDVAPKMDGAAMIAEINKATADGHYLRCRN